MRCCACLYGMFYRQGIIPCFTLGCRSIVLNLLVDFASVLTMLVHSVLQVLSAQYAALHAIRTVCTRPHLGS